MPGVAADRRRPLSFHGEGVRNQTAGMKRRLFPVLTLVYPFGRGRADQQVPRLAGQQEEPRLPAIPAASPAARRTER